MKNNTLFLLILLISTSCRIGASTPAQPQIIKKVDAQGELSISVSGITGQIVKADKSSTQVSSNSGGAAAASSYAAAPQYTSQRATEMAAQLSQLSLSQLPLLRAGKPSKNNTPPPTSRGTNQKPDAHGNVNCKLDVEPGSGAHVKDNVNCTAKVSPGTLVIPASLHGNWREDSDADDEESDQEDK